MVSFVGLKRILLSLLILFCLVDLFLVIRLWKLNKEKRVIINISNVSFKVRSINNAIRPYMQNAFVEGKEQNVQILKIVFLTSPRALTASVFKKDRGLPDWGFKKILTSYHPLTLKLEIYINPEIVNSKKIGLLQEIINRAIFQALIGQPEKLVNSNHQIIQWNRVIFVTLKQ
ncbi:hypothetical protein HY214_03890 [Candidatus Roizmanbacteria bacterium]|nr:hypothetical protein [Candidatus Roizmanbacteria bacterium]